MCTFSVALTSDICSGWATNDYLSVVAHYVNNDCVMEKRIICLKLINVSHTGENIAYCIIKVMEDFGFTNKIFLITLDNATSNSRAMDILTPVLSTYVDSFLLHQRCAYHIINLIVKCGLKRLSSYNKVFCDVIYFLNNSNVRIAQYKNFCRVMGVHPRKFGLYMPVRWKSTYLMLKSLLPYNSIFFVFIQTHYQSIDSSILLIEQHWFIAEKIL